MALPAGPEQQQPGLLQRLVLVQDFGERADDFVVLRRFVTRQRLQEVGDGAGDLDQVEGYPFGLYLAVTPPLERPDCPEPDHLEEVVLKARVGRRTIYFGRRFLAHHSPPFLAASALYSFPAAGGLSST